MTTRNAARDELLNLMRERGITRDDLLTTRGSNGHTPRWQEWIDAFLSGDSRLTDAVYDDFQRLAKATRTEVRFWLKFLPAEWQIPRRGQMGRPRGART